MSLLGTQVFANPTTPLWAAAGGGGGGATGPTGPTGATGPTGSTGSTGPAGGGSSAAIQTLFESQPSGTPGGTPPATGVYFTRTLNTGSPALSGGTSTTIAGMSLSANDITLPAGTYMISGSAPAFGVNRHKTRLYDLSTSNAVIIGQSSYSDATSQVQADSGLVEGVFTIGSSSIFQLQHQIESMAGPLGLGVSTNFGDEEIYSTITFQKIA